MKLTERLAQPAMVTKTALAGRVPIPGALEAMVGQVPLPETISARVALPGASKERLVAAPGLQDQSVPDLQEKSWIAVYADLFKARLVLLVLLTTLVGFYIGFRGHADYQLMFAAVIGTALMAGGAAALNELLERDLDARMRRTCDRPLPSGRLQPATVLRVGVIGAVLGVGLLAAAVNLLTAALGAISVLIYLFVYTPLKRVTWYNTAVGTIPGGLPALMGWTAARNEITWEGLALFGILAFWQLPHFMAIAWIYRDEYAKAGFKMLPVLDPAGRRTSHQAIGNILALLAVSVLPFVFKLTGPIYLGVALALGLAFFWTALRFAGRLTIARARQLFLMSIIYLPVLLVIMVLDKAK